MRYHYEKPEIYVSNYGETYICDHPVYDRCTLFKIGDRGLAVIQQRFNPETKETRWTEIDPWLTDAIYLNAGFKTMFETYAKQPGNKRDSTKISKKHSSNSTFDSEDSSLKPGKTDTRPEEITLYPTLTVRQVMWALKMKPLRRERWETVFDRKDI